VGRLNGDSTNAQKDAKQAVQTYTHLLEKPVVAEVDVVEITKGLTVMTLEATNVCNYADALKELHYSLSLTTRKNESVNAGIEALESYKALGYRHNSWAFSDQISSLCFSLASGNFRDIVSVDQALSYVRESVFHYEKMLRITGVFHQILLTLCVLNPRYCRV